MNQTVIQPLSANSQVRQPAPQPQMKAAPAPAELSQPEGETTTSAKPVSPDIIKLASNADLSIETIAREAHRISAKEASLDDENEVIISLR
jgi:hypothetical protein